MTARPRTAWARRSRQGGRRDKVFLMTKCCGRTAKEAQSNLEDSLRRLQTDHLDLWQFHEINYDNDPEWVFADDGAHRVCAQGQGAERSATSASPATKTRDPSQDAVQAVRVGQRADALECAGQPLPELPAPGLARAEQAGNRTHRHEEPGRPRQDRQRGRRARGRRLAIRLFTADRHAGLAASTRRRFSTRT